MVLHTWEDPSRGTTLLGQWIYDRSFGRWAPLSCIDTQYVNSGLTGSMQVYMEQFHSLSTENTRQFSINGMYAQSKSDGTWYSIDTATLQSAAKEGITPKGSYSFGANYGSFYGETNGMAQTDQSAHQKGTFSITQSDKPVFGSASISGWGVKQKEENIWTVFWGSTAPAPTESYHINILDSNGTSVCEKSSALPFEYQADITLPNLQDAYTCVLTLTDLFGNVLTLKEENFTGAELPSPSASGESPVSKEKKEEPSQQENFPSTSKAPPFPEPEDPAYPTTNTPKAPPPGRKIGVGVMVLFFAAGILAALGGAVGMIRQERSASHGDDG